MATGPDLRISDADREAAAANLREHYAQGRLSLEEFNQRLDAVFAATTAGQLARVTHDLPHVAVPSGPLAAAAGGGSRERARRGPTGPGPRRIVTAIATVFLTWLALAALLMPALWRLPLPGRLGMLLAIVAIARGLLRRIIGRGRGGGPRGGCGRRGHGRSRYGPGWGDAGDPWRGGSWRGGS